VLPHRQIEQKLREAVTSVLPGADTSSVQVRPCPDPKFGDYQSNALIALAKGRKMNPRQLATDVLKKLDVQSLGASVEIAGAGFLNFRLNTSTVEDALKAAAGDDHLFFDRSREQRTVIVDFSSPNVAKPMHVGHIRSTILGDSLSRILRLLGHRVITDNHLGDWGTQFGMLLVGWKTLLDRANLEKDPIGEMERIYKIVSGKADPDKPGFEPARRDSARAELVKLQSGNEENLAIWREMLRLSQTQFDTIYTRLGVKFDYTLGESFYNPRLQGVVDDLMKKNVAQESRGAKAIFSDGKFPPKEDPFLANKEGEWVANPFIVQKSDGGFNYATTDLATVDYRVEQWQPQEIIYITGGPQQLHFRQLFAAFARWQPGVQVKLAHVWFGSILGEDGSPFKTRAGDSVKLAELLDEAEERAFKTVSEKNPELPEAQRREIARVVGIGAVKYADLLPNRQSDYQFSWDKMLALNGNTAPYLLYAYARIRSIFRKGAESNENLKSASLKLTKPQEIALARHLLNFDFVLNGAADEYRPNFICNYLYELAHYFTGFYENCPVLKADPDVRTSRLFLCDLTARTLKQGLEVLGIETLEQM
jgi:arginyl-tRNA synthetase